MILIDVTKPKQVVRLTLDGRTSDGILYLKNDQTRALFQVGLGGDISPSPGRYNMFDLTGGFPGIYIEGYYTYEVKDLSGDIIETGKLRIIGTPYVADNLAPENVNNILIYKPNGE